MAQMTRRRFVGTLAGAGAGVMLARTSARAAEFTYKLANDNPLDHPMNVRLREAQARITEESKGRLELQLFPNNQLGGDTDMLSQVRAGAIEFFILSGPILANLVPLASINGIGFAFKDYDQVWAA
ncbi:MAG TPA: TRAP transporter substrate-binding protein DctP, partial [Stellaceae bacterium]|nr:TRAP transporter substrate-binding protein DctP [Stellaceae bacterium]